MVTESKRNDNTTKNRAWLDKRGLSWLGYDGWARDYGRGSGLSLGKAHPSSKIGSSLSLIYQMAKGSVVAFVLIFRASPTF
jgi:hypothetical protein